MATEILRPIGETGPVSSTLYPNTELSYSLVNESVADDDSTYILLDTDEAAGGSLCFDSTNLRNNYANIQTIKIVCRACAPSHSGINLTFNYRICNSAGVWEERTDLGAFRNVSKGWATLTLTNAENLLKTAILANISYCSEEAPLQIGLKATGQSGKSGDIKLTQMYIEITYTDDPSNPVTESILIKTNGSWTSLSGAFYKKENGIWVEATTEIFQNGNRYALQEVT